MAIEPEVALDDTRVKDLEDLIRESFRVRANHTPIYVDVADNLRRVSLRQHQVIYGRRGSGKSCLLVYYRRAIAPGKNVHSVYILGDTVKTLEYPDVLLRLLLEAFENLPGQKLRLRITRWVTRKPLAARAIGRELRELLALPTESALTVRDRDEQATNRKRGLSHKAIRLSREKAASQANEQVRVSDDRKVRTIENRLADYKAAIQESLAEANVDFGVFIIDDFYLIDREVQPDVVDYLHRLLRDTDLFFKIGTVQHRTTLVRSAGLHHGVQTFADVDGLNLDRTLEDLDQTSTYLETMLRQLGVATGITDVITLMSEDSRKDLTLLAGGVPRDYLNIFVGGLALARAAPKRRWITPTDLRKAAASLASETKLKDLRADAGGVDPALEGVFVDLVKFCLAEKRKTAFLVSLEQIQTDPATHELIQQLMDFKLIHLVEPSTSAASGRPGRYEAYTLDFALFMEPRRRNIEIVKFWETDDQRRRVKLREAPVYDLDRGAAIKRGGSQARAEDALRIAQEVEPDPDPSPVQLFLAIGGTETQA